MDIRRSRGLHGKVNAFTLLELVIVIAIIAVLMAIAVPSTAAYLRDARVASANDTAQELYNAAQDYLVSLQIRGKADKVSEYFGCDSTTGIGYIGSTFEGVAKVNASYEDPNNTLGGRIMHYSDVASFKNGTDHVMGSGAVDAKAVEAANEILGRMSSDFQGSWIIEVYPKTCTVRAVYYTSEKRNGKFNWTGVKNIKDHPYNVLPHDDSAKHYQDVDANNPGGEQQFVGQYPIPAP